MKTSALSRSPWLLSCLTLGTALLALAGPGCGDDDDDNGGAGTSAGTAGAGGSTAGTGGSTSGSGGAKAGTGGTSAGAAGTTGGTAGTTAGTAGAGGATAGTAGAGGTTAGTAGVGGATAGTAGAGGATAGTAGTGGSGGSGQGGTGGSAGAAQSFVYTESNDPAGNKVLAFKRAADGTLTLLSSYATGGKGLANPKQRLGPADSDQNFAWSADRKRLYAVNSGDSTIAGFDVSDDGSLKPLAGSPFAAGGNNPVSLALRDQILYVANKEDTGSAKPSYTSLTVAADGSLSPSNGGARVDLPIGASPTQVYLAPTQNLMFGTRFLDFDRIAMLGTAQIDAFAVKAGLFTPAPGAAYMLPADSSSSAPPVALDLTGHPTQNILYVGFPTRAKVGVYTYDAKGALTFVKTATNSGAAICWLRTTADGKRLYTVNSGSATVSLYDLTDPMTPVEKSHIALKDNQQGSPFKDATGMMQTLTSNPFQFELSPDEKQLYVVSQRVTTTAADTGGNALHTLAIAADGSLSETATPIDLGALGVPATARPQGIAVKLEPSGQRFERKGEGARGARAPQPPASGG